MHQSICSESRRRHRDAASEIRGRLQTQLEALIRLGRIRARKQTRARIRLKINDGMKVQEIMKALDVSAEMVYRARQRFVEEGLDAAGA